MRIMLTHEQHDIFCDAGSSKDVMLQALEDGRIPL